MNGGNVSAYPPEISGAFTGRVTAEVAMIADKGQMETALAYLAKKRPLQFEVLVLSLEGLTQYQIAEKLGISQAAVSQRMTKARKNMSKALGRLQA